MAQIEKIRVVQNRACELDLPSRDERGEFLRRIEYVRPIEPEGEAIIRVSVGLEYSPTHWPNYEAPSVSELVAFGRVAKAEASSLEGRVEMGDKIKILKEAEGAAVGVLVQAILELNPSLLTNNFSVSDRSAMSGVVKDKDF